MLFLLWQFKSFCRQFQTVVTVKVEIHTLNNENYACLM